MAGKVKVISDGRSGTVQYIEGWWKKNTCNFYWEFGAGDMILTIWFPAEDKWDASYPWASGRRQEVITNVAEQVRRQEARSSTLHWEADRVHFMNK